MAPLGIPLKKFLLSTVRPEDYYKAVVATVEGSDLYDLPERLTATVLGNIEFYNLYKTIKQIELEQSKIRNSGADLGVFGQDVATKLDMLRADRVREIGIKIQRILRESERQLQLYGEKLTEIEIDLFDMKIETEEEMLRSLEDGAEEEVAATVDTGGSTAIVGSDQWQWSFEGEYWKEEIGTYRAFVPNLCPPEEER